MAQSSISFMTVVFNGYVVDQFTRCVHYHLELAIVAIKFSCFSHYYPCYKCNEESETHPLERWPRDTLSTGKIILCGQCRSEWLFDHYSKQLWCTACGAEYNPGCAAHYHIYFEVEESARAESIKTSVKSMSGETQVAKRCSSSLKRSKRLIGGMYIQRHMHSPMTLCLAGTR